MPTIRRMLVGLMFAVAATAPLAAGLDTHPKWWQDPKIQAELGLTAQQIAAIDQTFESTVPRLRELKGQLDVLEADLSRLVRERTADEAVVEQQVERVEAVRSEMAKLRTMMLYRIHRTLTPAQHERLRALLDRRAKDRRDGGHRRK
ncbi:MAG TPA: periplasmic heavy metal sensor [Vicinamibacterales bacterium]|nr:periplasmic heavy metal sensor [Vicinamibacterales bacterium]